MPTAGGQAAKERGAGSGVIQVERLWVELRGEGRFQLCGRQSDLLEIAGKRGAVVCFMQKNDKVHLVLFKRCDVKCKLPVNGKPDIRTHGNWTVARWGDEEWIFVLMGKEGVDAKRLEGMF